VRIREEKNGGGGKRDGNIDILRYAGTEQEVFKTYV